jgi:hypothetical protein
LDLVAGLQVLKACLMSMLLGVTCD